MVRNKYKLDREQTQQNATKQEAGTYILECDTILIFVSAGLQVVVMKLTLCSVWFGTAYIMPKCDMVIGVLYSHLNVVIRMINIDLSQEQRTAPPPPKQNKTKQNKRLIKQTKKQGKTKSFGVVRRVSVPISFWYGHLYVTYNERWVQWLQCTNTVPGNNALNKCRRVPSHCLNQCWPR